LCTGFKVFCQEVPSIEELYVDTIGATEICWPLSRDDIRDASGGKNGGGFIYYRKSYLVPVCRILIINKRTAIRESTVRYTNC
jgi:hypothetical protein